VEYSRAEQALVAIEIESLPENTVIVDWLADYSLLKKQVSTCGS